MTDRHPHSTAAHSGESPIRLAYIVAWRDTNVVTGAERAVCELTEEGTRAADGKAVSVEVRDAARRHFYDDRFIAS